MKHLKKSPYSLHFITLAAFGFWVWDTKNPKTIKLFAFYRFLITATEAYVLYGLFLDLYMALGDMKKISWNLCVTTFIFGRSLKNHQMLQNSQTINSLRWMLHRDAESRKNPEDILVHDSALKELKILRFTFYTGAVIFSPIWLFTKYSRVFWGVRELPIPFYLPSGIDLENEFQFHAFFIFLGGAGLFGSLIAIETELAMYGLFIQMVREYKILHKDILKIDRLYSKNVVENPEFEINTVLKRHKTKKLLKMFAARQSKLIGYTVAFESSYNKPFLQQFFGIPIVILALALQCLWGSVEFSGNLLFQMGYLFTIAVNIFLICLFSSRLRSQCEEVGEKIYSTVWYEMGVDMQKDIGMIIMRSQNPPKITTGKFTELSLNFFMNLMSNLYGWLAVFQQLDASSSS